MEPLRKVFDRLETIDGGDNSNDDTILQLVKRDEITMEHVEAAMEATRPSCDHSWDELYAKWQNEYGSSVIHG